MELDLEKERCQDLEEEMKELRGRLGVVQRDSQKRMKEAQERLEEALKAGEERQKKEEVKVFSCTQWHSQGGGALSLCMIQSSHRFVLASSSPNLSESS